MVQRANFEESLHSPPSMQNDRQIHAYECLRLWNFSCKHGTYLWRMHWQWCQILRCHKKIWERCKHRYWGRKHNSHQTQAAQGVKAGPRSAGQTWGERKGSTLITLKCTLELNHDFSQLSVSNAESFLFIFLSRVNAASFECRTRSDH